MYCPKCAAQNVDDAKFCRACGTNLSLVQQAITGQLPEVRATKLDGVFDGNYQKRIEYGIKQSLMGIGFLVIAFAFWHSWGIWMLIPASTLLGRGISKIASVKYGRSLTMPPGSTAVTPARRTGELLPHNPPEIMPPEIMPPPSITEATTRNLDATVERPKNKLLQ